MGEMGWYVVVALVGVKWMQGTKMRSGLKARVDFLAVDVVMVVLRIGD